MKKNNTIHKLIKKKSFYFVLILGICILASSAFWVNKSKVQEDPMENNYVGYDESGDEIEEPIVFLDDEEILRDDDQENTQMASEEPVKNNDPTKTLVNNNVDEDIPVLKIEEKEATAASSLSRMNLIKPLDGIVGMIYAEDTLTYSKTLDQYTTHKGIDIEADIDTPVVAVLDGEVIEIVTDSRLGRTIAIAHANGVISRYANLNTSEMVSVGDVVEQGQTISGVGESALFEAEEKPHLHFEVLVDGKNIDPQKFIK